MKKIAIVVLVICAGLQAPAWALSPSVAEAMDMAVENLSWGMTLDGVFAYREGILGGSYNGGGYYNGSGLDVTKSELPGSTYELAFAKENLLLLGVIDRNIIGSAAISAATSETAAIAWNYNLGGFVQQLQDFFGSLSGGQQVTLGSGHDAYAGTGSFQGWWIDGGAGTTNWTVKFGSDPNDHYAYGPTGTWSHWDDGGGPFTNNPYVAGYIGTNFVDVLAP